MSAIYKIIGDDGREYGPVTAEHIQKWIGEHRVEFKTPVFVQGAADWNFVGNLPEFAQYFPGRTAAAPPVQPQPFPVAAPKAVRTSGVAIAGFICGILSLTFFCCLGGAPFNIFGVILSVIALLQIGAQPQVYSGRGLAIAGLILSAIGVLCMMLMLIFGHFNFAANLPQQWR